MWFRTLFLHSPLGGISYPSYYNGERYPSTLVVWDAINVFLLLSATDLHDLQTPLNARKSMTPSCIITNKSTSWLRDDHGPTSSVLIVLLIDASSWFWFLVTLLVIVIPKLAKNKINIHGELQIKNCTCKQKKRKTSTGMNRIRKWKLKTNTKYLHTTTYTI